MLLRFLGIVFSYNGRTGSKLDKENAIGVILERSGLAESAPVRVSIGGEDGD